MVPSPLNVPRTVIYRNLQQSTLRPTGLTVQDGVLGCVSISTVLYRTRTANCAQAVSQSCSDWLLPGWGVTKRPDVPFFGSSPAGVVVGLQVSLSVSHRRLRAPSILCVAQLARRTLSELCLSSAMEARPATAKLCTACKQPLPFATAEPRLSSLSRLCPNSPSGASDTGRTHFHFHFRPPLPRHQTNI